MLKKMEKQYSGRKVAELVVAHHGQFSQEFIQKAINGTIGEFDQFNGEIIKEWLDEYLNEWSLSNIWSCDCGVVFKTIYISLNNYIIVFGQRLTSSMYMNAFNLFVLLAAQAMHNDESVKNLINKSAINCGLIGRLKRILFKQKLIESSNSLEEDLQKSLNEVSGSKRYGDLLFEKKYENHIAEMDESGCEWTEFDEERLINDNRYALEKKNAKGIIYKVLEENANGRNNGVNDFKYLVFKALEFEKDEKHRALLIKTFEDLINERKLPDSREDYLLNRIASLVSMTNIWIADNTRDA